MPCREGSSTRGALQLWGVIHPLIPAVNPSGNTLTVAAMSQTVVRRSQNIIRLDLETGTTRTREVRGRR